MIPEDHICFLVDSKVESMDFASYDIRYSGAEHPAYHLRILLKILIMGILDRVRSSRRLAKNARELSDSLLTAGSFIEQRMEV